MMSMTPSAPGDLCLYGNARVTYRQSATTKRGTSQGKGDVRHAQLDPSASSTGRLADRGRSCVRDEAVPVPQPPPRALVSQRGRPKIRLRVTAPATHSSSAVWVPADSAPVS